MVTVVSDPNGSLLCAFSVGINALQETLSPIYMHTGNNGNFTGGFMFFRDKQLGHVVLTNGDHRIELDAKLAQILTFGFSSTNK